MFVSRYIFACLETTPQRGTLNKQTHPCAMSSPKYGTFGSGGEAKRPPRFDPREKKKKPTGQVQRNLPPFRWQAHGARPANWLVSFLGFPLQAKYTQMAVGQNQWNYFGVGVPPILEPILVGFGMFTKGTGF